MELIRIYKIKTKSVLSQNIIFIIKIYGKSQETPILCKKQKTAIFLYFDLFSSPLLYLLQILPKIQEKMSQILL